MRNIKNIDRLIVALDVPTVEQAYEIVSKLEDSVTFYKIGLELFTARGIYEFIQDLNRLNKQVFIDLKLYDIPTTVSKAIKNLKKFNPTFATVHACNENVVKAATSVDCNIGILGVTVLTSEKPNSQEDHLICVRTNIARKLGAVGVISSGNNIKIIRKICGEDLLIICPGIRNADAPQNDQSRAISAQQAFSMGADYIVVGRPIIQSENPKQSALDIQSQIIKGLNEN